MCEKHSFVMARNARIYHGYNITDSHSAIAKIHELPIDSLNKYEAQPGPAWPTNPRDWNITFDNVDRAAFEEKSSHVDAMYAYLMERFPTRIEWDAYIPQLELAITEGKLAAIITLNDGSLDLEGCTGLTSLPDNLSVGGSLYLEGCTGLQRR
ncbi:MAG TPA: hypothetical protein VGL77_15580 [Armatimonadota bacterium]